MTFFKRIQFLVLVLFPICLMGMDSSKHSTVSLEWIEITPQNISTMDVFLKQLEPVYISAFKDQEEACFKEEHSEEYQEMVKSGKTVEKALEESWQGNSYSFKVCFSQGLEKISCAILKNTQNDILGFAFFIHSPKKTILKIMQTMGLIKTDIQWIKENKEDLGMQDEAYVRLLAVRSDCQGRGFGKKLVFSILSILPQLKRIYLTTGGSKSNEKTQKFYEHCGFECTATYMNSDDEKMRIYEFNNKIEHGSWIEQDKTGKNVLIEWHKVTDYKTYFEFQKLLLPVQAASFGQQMKNSLLDEKRQVKPEYTQCVIELPGLMEVVKYYQSGDEKLFLDRQMSDFDKACAQCIEKQIVFPKTCFFIIAKNDKGEILGYAVFHSKSKYPKGSVRLEPLAVLPAAQGMGLGQKLIFSIRHILPETSRIFLKTSFWFTGAISVYRKLGFKESVNGLWHNFEYNVEKI